MKRRKKDYQRNNFSNPYFPRSKNKVRWRFNFFLVVFFFGIFFSIYFFCGTDFLKIENIEILGNNKISQEQVRQTLDNQLSKKTLFIFNQNNIFFFSKKKAINKLKEDYLIKDVKIKKLFFNTLKIEVKERVFSVVWVRDDNRYYLDFEGVSVKKVESNDTMIERIDDYTEIIRPKSDLGNNYPVIIDISGSQESTVAGSQLVDKKTVDFILEVNEKLESADFNMSHYEIASRHSRDIVLVTNEGWKVNFNTIKPSSDQIDLLFFILTQKVNNRGSLNYIDLRFEEKIFYK